MNPKYTYSCHMASTVPLRKKPRPISAPVAAMTRRTPHLSDSHPQKTPMTKLTTRCIEKAADAAVRDHPVSSVRGLTSTPKVPWDMPQEATISSEKDPATIQP